MATNEGRVYFALDGDDFDPDSLTDYLGIEPTSIMRKGARIPNKVPVRNSWAVSTENIVNEYIDVFDMACEITKQLIPKQELIIKAIQEFDLVPRLEVVLWFSVNEKHSTPALGFDSETIKFLGEIGAFIDVDTYKH